MLTNTKIVTETRIVITLQVTVCGSKI